MLAWPTPCSTLVRHRLIGVRFCSHMNGASFTFPGCFWLGCCTGMGLRGRGFCSEAVILILLCCLWRSFLCLDGCSVIWRGSFIVRAGTSLTDPRVEGCGVAGLCLGA